MYGPGCWPVGWPRRASRRGQERKDYMPASGLFAPASLLLAAGIWGLVWYPYRLLQEAGVSGSLASLLTYLPGIPLLVWLAWRRDGARLAPGLWPWLLAVSLGAGWTNLSYVLAVIDGEVVRVMLLFYLAPLWTVFFARLVLGERAGAWGWAVIALALGGAFVMLGGGASGLPLPGNTAEWLGLSSGVGFAFTNVATRKAVGVPMQLRSLGVFIGVALISLLFHALERAPAPDFAALPTSVAGLVVGVTLLLLLATWTVQYGLARLPANQAIVILLFELVVAAASGVWLAGESLDAGEWLGGAMIAAATVLSIKAHRHD